LVQFTLIPRRGRARSRPLRVQNVTPDLIPVIAVEWPVMTDPSEIAALKAAFQGAIGSGVALAAMRERVDALELHTDIPAATLDELASVSAAHAIASAALRGLVNTMLARRTAT